MLIKTYSHKAVKQQQGSVLLISLVLMAVLTLLGLSSMRTSLTGEKIAGQVQDTHLATEAAESALRRGQREVRTRGHQLTSLNMHFTSEGQPPPSLSNWTNGPNNPTYTVATADLAIPAADDSKTPLPRPQYKLEEFFVEPPDAERYGQNLSLEENKNRGTTYFRIFGRGLGRGGENQVILQGILIEDVVGPPSLN